MVANDVLDHQRLLKRKRGRPSLNEKRLGYRRTEEK